MQERIQRILVVVVFAATVIFSGLLLTRDLSKAMTFVSMGDIWSFIRLREEPPGAFVEIDLEDYVSPPYPAVGDSLLEVNGLPATRENYFTIFGPDTPSGMTLPIRFTHGDKVLTTTVVTRSIPRPLEFQVISLFVLRTLITLALILVGFWAFVRRPGSSAVRTLALFCFSMALGMLINRNAIAEGYAHFDFPYRAPLITAFQGLAFFAPVFWLKLQLVFPKAIRIYAQHGRLVHVLLFGPGLLIGAIYVTTGLDLTVPTVAHTSLYVGLAGYLLARNYFRAPDFVVRRQIRLVLWGSLPGVTLYAAIPWLMLLAGGWLRSWSTVVTLAVTNVTYLLVLCIPLSFAYAFGRYRLLEVEGRLRRGTRLVAVNVLLLVACLALLYIVGDLIAARTSSESRVPMIAMALLLAVGFAPAQRRVRFLIDERFYPERVRLRTLLRDFLHLSGLGTQASSFWQGLSERLTVGLSAAYVRPVLREGQPNSPAGACDRSAPSVEEQLIQRLGYVSHPLLVDELVASGKSLLDDSQLAWLVGRDAAVLLPLRTATDSLGFLLLGRKTNGEDYAPDELVLLRSLAAQIALVAENIELLEDRIERQKLQEQLGVARQIQEGMLPGELPGSDGLELAARIRFCLDVAGDYYDVIPLESGETLLAIGDVAGKGVGAALLMANLQASLRAVKDVGIPLTEVVQKINALVFDNTPVELFITLFVGIYDPRTRKLTYVNAGHNHPMLHSENGMRELSKGGLILGVARNAFYESETVDLSPGDTLLLYTDGVSEAMDERDQEFGEDKIASILGIQRSRPIGDCLQALEDAVVAHHGSETFEDDFTLLAARVR